MKRQGKVASSQEFQTPTKPSVETTIEAMDISRSSDVSTLQAEIKRLKKALEHESLRTDVYDEMINVAEQQFGISIRKKVAPSSK